MFSSRPLPVLRVALLALAVGVVPACSGNSQLNPPAIIASTPAAPGNNVGLMPNILVKFDRAMDQASINDVANWAVVASGAPTGEALSFVEYIPALNEARIVLQNLLAPNTIYTVFISSNVKSAEGRLMGFTDFFGFTTTGAGTTTLISWAGVTSATPGPGAGEITFVWPAATGSGANIGTYDVFLATATGAEDLMVRVAPNFQTISNQTGGTVTGLTPNTQYFIKVQPRDSQGAVFTSLAQVSAMSGP